MSDSLAKKLLEVKKQVTYLQDDGKSYNYKYVTPEQLLLKLNPIMNGLNILLKSEVTDVISSERIESSKGKFETLFVIKMRMTFINCEDDKDIIQCEWASSGCNGNEKGYGSALTYGERYFLLKFFNIPTGNDDPDKYKEDAETTQQTATHNPKTENKKTPEPDADYDKINKYVNDGKIDGFVVADFIKDVGEPSGKFNALSKQNKKVVLMRVEKHIGSQ